MTVGATLVASLLAVLERPATWPLALAGFLIRGGLLVVLVPILVLPTAIGVANVLTPILSSAVLSGLAPSTLLLLAGIGVAGVVWLMGGGALAGAVEAEAVRIVAAGDGPPTIVSPRVRRDAPWRVLAVRLVAYLPLVIAFILGSMRVVAAVYREFTVPVDIVTPLVLRVVRNVPDAIVAILVTWLFGEILGAMAARRVILYQEGTVTALRRALVRLFARPLHALVYALVPLVALVAVIVPSAAAASASWSAIRVTLVDDLSPVLTVGAVLLLVGVWAGQLVLIGLVAAWRASVWTVDLAGTFGGVAHDPEGVFPRPAPSGTVSDPPSALGATREIDDHENDPVRRLRD